MAEKTINEIEPMELTLVIPVYNRADMLAQALESLRRQTLKDFVVVICDDASTENIKDTVDQFPDLSIEYHRFNKNAGQFKNMVRGLELCRTPLIKYLHTDDLLFPEALKKQVDAMRSMPDAAMCSGGILRFKEAQNRAVEIINYEQPYVPCRIKGKWVDLENYQGNDPSSVMFRIGLLHEAGGLNVGLDVIGDWEICVALSARYPILAVNEPVCAWRIHDNQLTNKTLFESEEDLQTRDVLWMTSDENPFKQRLGLPSDQLKHLRYNLVWQNLRISIKSRKMLRKWFIFMRNNHLFGSFILAFPLFVIRKLNRKPKATAKMVENINMDEYRQMISALLAS